MIFIADPYDKSGGSFLHYIKLTGIVPKQVLIVSIVIENYPYISEKKRYELKKLGGDIYNLTLHFGFVQRIDLPRTLMLGHKMKILPFSMEPNQLIYLVEIINAVITKKKYPNLFFWQKKLFVFLLRNSEMDYKFFGLPDNRTIAIGSYCKI